MIENRQTRIVSYPLNLGSNGSYVTVPTDVGLRSQLRFYLDFTRGMKFWDTNYGTDIELLEQEGSELNALVPVHLMILRLGLMAYIRGIGPEIALSWSAETQGNTRKVGVEVAVESSATRRVQTLQHENEVIWQA